MTFLTQSDLDAIRNNAGAAALKSLETLKEISQLLGRAENLFNNLDATTKDALREYHNENTSLEHCLRWGNQASNELVSLSEKNIGRNPKRRLRP